jgi:hypothetical protein
VKTVAQRVAALRESGIDGPPLSRGDVAGAFRAAQAYKFKDCPSFFTRKPKQKGVK